MVKKESELKAQNIILDAESSAENLKKEKVLEAKEEVHQIKDNNTLAHICKR